MPDALAPAERLAFVLHDMFAVPFDEIAAMVDRSPEATRQLASRARRRVREAAPAPDPDLTRQRAVVDAYFAAAREGDLAALVAVLDPDVVLRAHRRDGDPPELHGAARVARGAMTARLFAPYVRPALINGAAGVVAFDGEQPFAVLAFTVVGDRAIAIDVFNEPELVARLDIRASTNADLDPRASRVSDRQSHGQVQPRAAFVERSPQPARASAARVSACDPVGHALNPLASAQRREPPVRDRGDAVAASEQSARYCRIRVNVSTLGDRPSNTVHVVVNRDQRPQRDRQRRPTSVRLRSSGERLERRLIACADCIQSHGEPGMIAGLLLRCCEGILALPHCKEGCGQRRRRSGRYRVGMR